MAVGVCDSCVVSVSDSQASVQTHLHTLPPYGHRGELHTRAVAVVKQDDYREKI